MRYQLQESSIDQFWVTVIKSFAIIFEIKI